MKLSGPVEKWIIGGLGAVSLALLVNVVLQFGGVWAGGGRTSASTAAGLRQAQGPERKSRGEGSRSVAQGHLEDSTPPRDELGRYDPVVRLDLLKHLQDQPLPELDRNPFEMEAPPARPTSPQSASAPTPAQPPAPPPVSLKPMGYSEKPGGVPEAFVSDEEQVYVVHEGDMVAGKYKILKITPKALTVEDASSHQTADLPIPQ